jgi:hypothetical protein
MKSKAWILIAWVAVLLAVFTDRVVAATYRTGFFNGDANSGVSSSKTYTHAVDLAGSALTINGVSFEAGTQTGSNYTFTAPGLSSVAGGSGVSGQMCSLVSNCYFSGGSQTDPQTLQLTGLATNTSYRMVFYNRGWGNAGERVINITDSQGGSYSGYDQNWAGNGNGNLLVASYTTGPAETSITFNFTSVNPNNSFHQYGFSNEIVTNEVVSGRTIVSFSDNYMAAGNPDTLNLNYNLAGRQSSFLTNITYTGSGNAQVGNNTGNIDGGNYLLTANAKASPNYSFNNSIPAPLVISLDMAPNIGANADRSVWAGVCVGLTVADQPAFINAGGGFGILFRGNGLIQAFSGSTDITSSGTGSNVWDGGSGDSNNTTNMTPIRLEISDLSGTGSGIGTFVNAMVKIYASNVLIHTYTNLGGGLLSWFPDNYVNFQAVNGAIAGFDNVKIEHKFVLISPQGTNVVGSQSYIGNMFVAENAIYELDAGMTTADVVSVSGQLALPTNLTVNVKMVDKNLADITPLFYYGSVTGNTDLATWSITGVQYRNQVELQNGNKVVLRIFRPGTVLTIR